MRASAPGKLLLFGEYAVLEGAPALVAAVDRRCTVSLEPAPAGCLVSPQIAPGPIAYVLRDGAVRWDCGAGQRVKLRLAERLLTATAREPLRVRVDTSAFFAGESKLGLGSSAAMAVAWVAALRGIDEPDALFAEALAIHRRFQQGRGSGADIAASVRGGVVAMGLGRAGAHRSLPWPGELCWSAVWTGRSADTREFLRRLGAWQEREPSRYDRRMRELAQLADSALEAFGAGDVSAILALADGYADALERLGGAAGIPIVSRVHAALRDQARAAGVAYKTSGAGGGDFGIALAADPAALRRFGAGVERAGATLLELALDPDGARLETDPEPQGL